jgi:WD40 repeat protein
VFHPDALTCASIERGALAVRLFDLAAAREQGVQRLPRDQPDDRFLRLVYRPNGQLLALCAAKPNGQKTWGLQVRDVTAGRTLFTVREQGLATISESALHRWAAFSADGSRLAVADAHGVLPVQVWDVGHGKVVGTLPAGTYQGGGVIQLSPDGRKLAVARILALVNRRRATGFSLFDVDAGKLLREGDSNNLCFSPDGHLLAANAQDDKVVLFDTATGAALHTLAGAGLIVAFSPDGKRLATTRKVWDTATGKALCAWDLNVWAAGAFSPDGSRLATRGNDFERNQVEIWDPQTGHQLFTLRGPAAQPLSRIHFSRDGHRLVAVDMQALYVCNATPVEPAAGPK